MVTEIAGVDVTLSVINWCIPPCDLTGRLFPGLTGMVRVARCRTDFLVMRSLLVEQLLLQLVAVNLILAILSLLPAKQSFLSARRQDPSLTETGTDLYFVVS